MGADFLLYAIPACNITAERRAALSALIDAIPDDATPGWIDSPDDWRAHLEDAIEEVANCEGRRDVCTARFEGMAYPMHFTGGMSWGDSPTDIADSFNALADASMILDKLHEWACQDCKAECVA